MNIAEVLKALGDETRLKIMCLLSSEKKCVCHIEETLGISQSSTSKQLNKLRSVGLINNEKQGQWVHYYIPDDAYKKFPFLKCIIEEAKKIEPYSSLLKECKCHEKGSVCLCS